jgi:hypothetical protein
MIVTQLVKKLLLWKSKVHHNYVPHWTYPGSYRPNLLFKCHPSQLCLKYNRTKIHTRSKSQFEVSNILQKQFSLKYGSSRMKHSSLGDYI